MHVKTTTQINFSVKITDLDKLKKYLRQPNMTKAQVGEHVFNYFMESEGLK